MKRERPPIPFQPKQLDYAKLRARGYAGSEFDAHLETGEYREGAGDLKSALGHYLAAIDLSPTSALAYRRAGEIYYRLGWFSDSFTLLLRAYTHGDRSPHLAFSLGLAAEKVGDLKAALHHFDRCLAVHTRDAKAYHHRARVLWSAGKTEAAIRDLQTAIELEPKFLAAFFDLARCHALSQDADAAIAALRSLQHSRRWLAQIRKSADLRYLRQFPSFLALLSGKVSI